LVTSFAILATTKGYEQIRDSSGRFVTRQPSIRITPGASTAGIHTHDSTDPISSFANTRPSSSLSTYEILYNTQTTTPFELTPPISPIKTPSSPLPNVRPPSPHGDIMATEHVAAFHGDKKEENPEDFLRSFFRRMGAANDDVKKQQFPNFLQADSAADEWFDELTQVEKKDWPAIEAAFHLRWPRKKAAKKAREEYEAEITGLGLKTEDLGKKETIAGREVYSHIAWADEMAAIVKGAKLEATTTYIGHVRKELPKVLKDKVGTVHADWGAFLQAVRDVDIEHIKDGADTWRKEQDTRKKEQDEQETLRKRIQQLEKLTASPTAPLRQQMTSFGIGNSPQPSQQVTTSSANPFASNTGGRGNLFQTTLPRPAAQINSRPQATLADRTALMACILKYPHHPDTEAGRQAHRAQQADWARTHGLNAMVTESTPYPLRPGTSPVGSGECFTCGFQGHMGRRDGSTCGGNRALHPHEQTWRAISSRILRQTRSVANIQLIAMDDYGTAWQEGQGNEDGPSN
jgi:hypothetical protein